MLTESLNPSALGHWRDYAELCKPRVVGLIVFTAVIGMFLATPGAVPLSILLPATVGIGLAASSAAAINHVAEHRIDALMARAEAIARATPDFEPRARWVERMRARMGAA